MRQVALNTILASTFGLVGAAQAQISPSLYSAVARRMQ